MSGVDGVSVPCFPHEIKKVKMTKINGVNFMLNLQKLKKTIYFMLFFVCISSGFWAFSAELSLPKFLGVKSVLYLSENAAEDLYKEKIKDKQGNEFLISSFNGQLVIIAVTTTWCPHCIKALMELDNLAKLKIKNVKIISLIASAKDSPLTPNAVSIYYFAYDIKNLDPYYSVDEKVFLKKYSNAIPAFFVFSPSGKLLVSYLGCPELSSEKFLNFIKSVEKISHK